MTVLDLVHVALAILGTCLGAAVLAAARDLYRDGLRVRRARELEVLRGLQQGPEYVDRLPPRLHRVLLAMEAAKLVTRSDAGLWRPRAVVMLTPAGHARLRARTGEGA